MRLLHMEAVTVGRPEESLPSRRFTEMVIPLTFRSKEPCSFLEARGAVIHCG